MIFLRPSRRWAGRFQGLGSMTDVIRVLRREHANISKLIKTLERQVATSENSGVLDYGIIEGIADYFLSFPDLYHHPKENLVFAKLRERDPAAAKRVGDLQCEHDEIASRARDFAAAARSLRAGERMPGEPFEKWARDFLAFQKDHMEKEERLFFPAALAVLTPEDWRELEARMTDQEDPLFGENVGDRYEALHANILQWEQEDRER
jgi:hemerythrin-like domain-containing protein